MVRFEPLDEESFKQVQKLIEANKAAETEKRQETPSEEKKLDAEREAYFAEVDNGENIAFHIQNERNASIFYDYLKDIVSEDRHRNILSKISDGSEKRHFDLNDIYREKTGKEYVPKDSKINRVTDIKQGLGMAVNYECKSSRELMGILDETEDNRHKKMIESIIQKKFVDISSLNIIIMEMNGLI